MQQISQGFLTDIARCNKDIPQTFFMRQTGGIDYIFYISKRFGLGIGDAWTVVLQTETHHLFWCEVVMIHLFWGYL